MRRLETGWLGWKTIAWLSMAASACDADPPTPSALVTDSLGVQIVESPQPKWEGEPIWSLDPEPSVAIGSDFGEEAEQLFAVNGVRRLKSGALVIANAGTGELRFFDGAGTFVRSVGGQGGGPGEFSGYSSMRLWILQSGVLAVSDEFNDRINLFTVSGQYDGLLRLNRPPQTPRASLENILWDGSLLARAVIGGGRLEGAPGSVIQDSIVFQRYTQDGEYLGNLVGMTGRARYVHEFGGITRFPYVPFSDGGLVAVQKNGLLVLPSGAGTLERYDLNGRLERLIRWKAGSPVLVRDIWEEYVAEALDRIEDERSRRWYESFYREELPLPEYPPRARAIVVDALQYIWIMRYQTSPVNAPEWDILSPEGEWLGQLTTPHGLTVHHIGHDYVLGVHEDSMGVERVQSFVLRR